MSNALEPAIAGRSPAYVLGHADPELARLTRQADFIDPITRRFFQEAGIEPGMRVLDVGSGAGHAAFIAAQLVGETGEVIGTDRATAAVTTARANADARALRNVSFRQGDPAEMIFDQPFDAVVGRYVLLFNRDRPAMLRRLARHLKPGGLIVLHEPTLLVVQSIPRVDLYERCCRWLFEGFRIGGTELDTAHTLHGIFIAAGLPPPSMRMEVPIGGAPGIFPWLDILVGMLRTLVPVLKEHRIAAPAEIEIDTLAERLERDIAASGSTILGRADVAAWSRV